MRGALNQVVGTYGIAVVDAELPGTVVVARNGSPVVLGIGEKEMFAASDVAAVVRYTRQIVHLDDGELAVVRAGGFPTFTLDARTVDQAALDRRGRRRRLRHRPGTRTPGQGDPRAARGHPAHPLRPPRRALRHRAPRRPRT